MRSKNQFSRLDYSSRYLLLCEALESICWRSQAKPSVSKQLTTTIGTNLYRLGVPDKVIRAILRHSNVGVTLGDYLKPQSADVIAAMSRDGEAKKEVGECPVDFVSRTV